MLSIHHTLYLGTCEQLSCFKHNTACSSVKSINPKLFVQNLTRKYQNLHLRITFLNSAANSDTNSCGTTQPEIQQDHIGQLFFHKWPKFLLRHCRTDDLCFRYLIPKNLFGTLQFEFYVFYNYYIIHTFLSV